MPALNKLYKQYRDRAAFYVVYIQEAHPIDAWQVNDNLKDDVLVASTMTAGDRLKVAGLCVKNLGIELPALVDEPDNRVERDYTGCCRRFSARRSPTIARSKTAWRGISTGPV